MSYKKFALKDVLPNPYRDLTRFPEKPEKIEALKASYEATGFWENIEGREVKGKLELAYGHNRLKALLSVYKKTDEFNFIVRDLSDSDMILRMSHENDEAYTSDISGVCETVRAVVLALAEGKIPRGNAPGQMPEVSKDTPLKHICQAPSFITGVPSSKLDERCYTATTIAVYLGRTKENENGSARSDNSVIAALVLLRLEEMKVPGWTAADSSKLDELRNSDGAIPADRVLRIAGDILKRYHEVLKAEAKKAEVVKKAGMTTQQHVDAEKAQKAERKEAQKILDAQHAAETKEALEAEAAARVAKKKQDKIDAEEREKARKIAERLYESEREAISKSAKALTLLEEQRLKKEESARASLAKLNRENTIRILSPADPLFEGLKKEGRDPRTTEKERTLQIEALDDIVGRVEQAKKLMRPEPAKKEKK
jgi:hypothetical protein